MANSTSSLDERYRQAAPRWADKMRMLGYYDGYLGFLRELAAPMAAPPDVIDIGAGTGTFAEAFVTQSGPPKALSLLDPSEPMLQFAQSALEARGVEVHCLPEPLGQSTDCQYDVLLAAHVIEHFDDPGEALAQMRRLARSGARLWLVVSKPHWCNALIWFKWRHRTFRKSEIAALIEAAGFAVEAYYDFPSGPPSRTSFAVLSRAN